MWVCVCVCVCVCDVSIRVVRMSMYVSGSAGDCRANVVAAGVLGIVSAGTGAEVSIRSVRGKHAAGTS